MLLQPILHCRAGKSAGRVAATAQAALHGLLTKVRDLGIPLIAVTRLDPKLEQGDKGMNTTHGAAVIRRRTL
jgi:hypothetical protein